MDEQKQPILHELYVFCEWKPEPEFVQAADNYLPENVKSLWNWIQFIGPKKNMLENVAAYKEFQEKWQIAIGDEGKVIAVLTENILEIRTKRSDYSTIAARTTVMRDANPQWRKIAWSPDCSFVVLAHSNGTVCFYDLTATKLFNIAADCPRPEGNECTDTTHAISAITFIPTRVKENKWTWEVLLVTYDGNLRNYLVSQTDGAKLQHSFKFLGGVTAVSYNKAHNLLFVAGLPHNIGKNRDSPSQSGITAWRILNDTPFYKLSVVSDHIEALGSAEQFQYYVPFISRKKLTFVVNMVVSPDGSKVICLHCNGDISVWRLPLLKLLHRWSLTNQPEFDLKSPFIDEQKICNKKEQLFFPVDVNWWSLEEIILSRFNGAVSICSIQDMVNILGKKPEFLKGAPQVTSAHDNTFLALECESNTLPPKKIHGNESTDQLSVLNENEHSLYEVGKELLKSLLYAITDIEHFQPKPKKITVVSRTYRLLGIKSTTPSELFTRKIESGNYEDALNLAESFQLNSDLVYQQQWRKTPVSADAILMYLSKVKKKIWAVHQCVDRLPETLNAAKELLGFGLKLTNAEIMNEIKNCGIENVKCPEDITLEHLDAYTSELLRCRHVMLFYQERLHLYEAILKCEKSSYSPDEYHRLRSNSIVYSSVELAKEGRIEALTCLWPQIKTVSTQLAVIEKLPETINPLEYKHLLPMLVEVDTKSSTAPIFKEGDDWCRKDIFRSIWSSNWSEDSSPENEACGIDVFPPNDDICQWYERRARVIEECSGIVSHSLTLISLAVEGGVQGLQAILFNLLTLDTLIYDVNLEDVTLCQIEKLPFLEICTLLMTKSTPATFVEDIKLYVIPFLKRLEIFTNRAHACINGLSDYLENLSVDDLSPILLVFKSPRDFELDVRTHLELAERCLLAHQSTDQFDKACDILSTILKESDESIASTELLRRLNELERLFKACNILNNYEVNITLTELKDERTEPKQVQMLLTKMARNLSSRPVKPTQHDWETLLSDILELQANLFKCITKETCYEIYAASLLTSGNTVTIKLASAVLTCDINSTNRRGDQLVNYERTVSLILSSAKEYFNSASSLNDSALDLARCCLNLNKDGNEQICEELDLISALQILHSFGITMLPIQVRLTDDRMKLIDDCLTLDTNAYMASHKLLKLANLMRIAPDDDHKREGMVLQRVCECAISAGAAGATAAVEAARRLAALRHAPAAALLAHVGANAHADRTLRRSLLAAAATHCSTGSIEEIIRARLNLELQALEQELGEEAYAVGDRDTMVYRKNDSIEDHFSDAVTTPIIEKKDLVAPSQNETKMPLLNFFLDTWHNKNNSSGGAKGNASLQPEGHTDSSVHCPEFYKSLYPEYNATSIYYGYDRFSLPDYVIDGQPMMGQSVLKWFYIQHCLDVGSPSSMENKVVQKCAEELLFKDTALSVSCLLASEASHVKKLIDTQISQYCISLALYSSLIKFNQPMLNDYVFLTAPIQMGRLNLGYNTDSDNSSEDIMEVIKICLDKLLAVVDCNHLKSLGYSVNSVLFNADEDCRKEYIYQVARSSNRQHMEIACKLALKYGLCIVSLWSQHMHTIIRNTKNSPGSEVLKVLSSEDMLQIFRANKDTTIQCLTDEVWENISGQDHTALIYYFQLLRNIDDKILWAGLASTEHIKYLKKTKAACSGLDYKLLLKSTPDELTSHLLRVMTPENAGMITKLLRNLTPAIKISVPINSIYTTWLTKYFFSVPPNSASSKKWMQQYRQCVSYFNKLSNTDLLQFIKNTCFSVEGVDRVPAGTRNLMIMQAVDYCQQEQENDLKYSKSENTWCLTSQELTRWARFLENFHSSTVKNIAERSHNSTRNIWSEIEMTRGEPTEVKLSFCKLVMEADMKPQTLATLIQCLHVDMSLDDLFRYILDNYVSNLEDMQTYVTCLAQYHMENLKISDILLEDIMKRAQELGLPPQKQMFLLSLNQKNQLRDSGDLKKIAQLSIDLLSSQWGELDCILYLAGSELLTEDERSTAFMTFLSLANNWKKKKVLVDILNIWPVAEYKPPQRSLHCELINVLLSEPSNQKENLVLLKLLVKRPVISNEEAKWLLATAQGDSIVNAIWLLLLLKSDGLNELIPKLVQEQRNTLEHVKLEDELLEEMLDNGLFIKLVSTWLYPSIITYIVNNEATESTARTKDYSLNWAVQELVKSSFFGEAGQLQLMTLGIPKTLKGFSESVLYCKTFKK